jgi:uncharacterized membrane protein YhaH (DUF805 family)
MSPLRACERVLRHPFTFAGRASRSEFWWWWLVTTVVAVSLQLGLSALAGTFGPLSIVTGPFGPGLMAQIPVFTSSAGVAGDDPLWATVPVTVWLLVVALPSIALASRRLHDANFSARWLFLTLLAPGVIVVMVMLASESRPAGARFDQPAENMVRPALRM